MNLNGESGDWDNLQKNVDLVIADVTEDYGWNFLLSYGVITEPVEIVGRRRERVIQYRHLVQILPFEWTLAIPKEMEISVEIPLGILVVDTSFILEHALGITKTQEIDLKIPLSTLIWHLSDLEFSIPLTVFRSQSIDFEMPLGKTLRGSRKKLNKLKKALEELDKA